MKYPVAVGDRRLYFPQHNGLESTDGKDVKNAFNAVICR